MVMCVIQDSEGYLLLDGATSLDDCADTSLVVLQKTDYTEMMSYTQITSGEVTEAFGLGFAAVFVAGFCMTYTVKVALQLVKLI